jgi:hypothetical protein
MLNTNRNRRKRNLAAITIALAGLLYASSNQATRSPDEWPAVTYPYFSPTNWVAAIGLPDDVFKCAVDNLGTFMTEFGRADQWGGFANRPVPHYVAILADVEEGSRVVEQRMYSPRVPVPLTRKKSGDVEIVEQLFSARPLDWDAMATGDALKARPSRPDVRQYLLMTEYRNTGKEPATITPILIIDGNEPSAELEQSSNVFRAASNTCCRTTLALTAFESLPVPAKSTVAARRFMVAPKRSKAVLGKITLAPGETARWVLAIERNGYEAQKPVEWAEAETLRQAAIAWWEKSANLPYDVIRLPDPEIQAVLDTGIRELYQMRYSIEGVQAFYFGPGCYNSFWVLDSSFVDEAVAMLGRPQDAAGNIEYLLRSRRPDGSIKVIPRHWKETGIALLTMYRHARLTQDKEWLSSRWDTCSRAVESIRQLRRGEGSSDPAAPNYRLAPAGFGDGGIGIGLEYTNNHWLLAGLKSAIEAARWLGRTQEADAWEEEYRDYLKVFQDAIRRDAQTDKYGNTYIPVMMPDQRSVKIEKNRQLLPGETEQTELRKSPIPPPRGQWAFCHAVYPGRIFAKDDPLMLSTLRMLQAYEVQGGLIELGAWGDVWPQFAGSFYGHDWLWLGDGQKAARQLYAFANHASPWRNFCEEMSIKGRGTELRGDMPHVSASAEFIRLTGHLLAFDRDDELHLLEGMPSVWAKPGMTTRVKKMGTPFGPLTMELTVADDGKTARLHVEPLSDSSCSRLVVHTKGWTGSADDQVMVLDPKKAQNLVIPLERTAK